MLSPDKKAWIRFLTPQSIGREITSFDRSNIFEPGEYTLKAPNPGNRLDAYHGRGGIGTGKGKKRTRRHVTANIRQSAWQDVKRK